MTDGQIPRTDATEPESSRRRFRGILRHIARMFLYLKRKALKLFSALRFLARFVGSEIRHPVRRLFPLIGLLAITLSVFQVLGLSKRTPAHLLPLVIFLVVFLVVIICTLSFIPRKKYVTIFSNSFGWLPVSIGAASYYYWLWYASNFGTPDAIFFHASADVLPVLLLAAVVDVRRSESLESRQLVLPIIAVFLGEVAALSALAFGNVRAGDFAAVASSLVSTSVALVLAVMADLPESDRKDAGERDAEQVESP